MDEAFERLIINRKNMLKKMNTIAPTDIEKIKEFARITESVACPTYPYSGEMHPISYRQYAVANTAFVCASIQKTENCWWEIYDFIRDGKEENVEFLELQFICLMLRALIAAAEKDKPIVIE